MDVMALQCRTSMAVMAMDTSSVGREAELQRGGAVTKLKVTKLSLRIRCNAISAGALCAGPPESEGESSLSASSLGGGAKSGGRDWRVHSSGNASGHRGEDGGRSGTRLSATVEKANDVASTQGKNVQMFGSSEASCDEGSSYLQMETVLEHEGGKSAEDYKLRAHIFSESDIFFTALMDRNSHSANY